MNTFRWVYSVYIYRYYVRSKWRVLQSTSFIPIRSTITRSLTHAYNFFDDGNFARVIPHFFNNISDKYKWNMRPIRQLFVKHIFTLYFPLDFFFFNAFTCVVFFCCCCCCALTFCQLNFSRSLTFFFLHSPRVQRKWSEMEQFSLRNRERKMVLNFITSFPSSFVTFFSTVSIFLSVLKCLKNFPSFFSSFFRAKMSAHLVTNKHFLIMDGRQSAWKKISEPFHWYFTFQKVLHPS